jgi:hypothetical protein
VLTFLGSVNSVGRDVLAFKLLTVGGAFGGSLHVEGRNGELTGSMPSARGGPEGKAKGDLELVKSLCDEDLQVASESLCESPSSGGECKGGSVNLVLISYTS